MAFKSGSKKPVEIFYSYARNDEDEELRDQLETHLSSMRHEGLITGWHDQDIIPGDEWERQIDSHLAKADIILLLISADFLASDYCVGVELKLALARHEANKAHVIPVILRPVDWQSTLFSGLEALPENGKAVTSWRNQDEAFFDIAHGIRRVVERRSKRKRYDRLLTVGALVGFCLLVLLLWPSIISKLFNPSAPPPPPDQLVDLYNCGLRFANGDAKDLARCNQVYRETFPDRVEITDRNKRVFDCYLKAAEGGYAEAQNNLGILYKEGISVKKNLAEAKRWFKNAADKKNPKAMNNLGILYQEASNEQSDYQSAHKWFARAIALGSCEAQYNLGSLYENGKLGSPDLEQAVEFYEAAWQRCGQVNAACRLGFLYAEGIGVQQNAATALEYIAKAADEGGPECQELRQKLRGW